jgi:hypothetical protein
VQVSVKLGSIHRELIGNTTWVKNPTTDEAISTVQPNAGSCSDRPPDPHPERGHQQAVGGHRRQHQGPDRRAKGRQLADDLVLEAVALIEQPLASDMNTGLWILRVTT